MDTPTTEPSSIHAGDTISWIKQIADYLSSDGWTLSYALKNSSSYININATGATGGSYLVTVSATASTAYNAGSYDWQSYVHKGSGATLEQHTIDSGRMDVLANFAGTTAYDGRSDNRKNYDYALAFYRQCISLTNGQVLEKAIAGRSIRYRGGDDIKKVRDELSYWAGNVRAEEEAERIRNGMPSNRRCVIRFERP